MKIEVKIKENKITSCIYIGKNYLSKFSQLAKQHKVGNFAVIITNPSLDKIYRNFLAKVFKGLPHKKIIVPDSEKAKSWTHLENIIQTIIRINPKNRIFIVCFGGGVITDLGGFAASIYKRGIPYINIPTSLLAQVDASIGGKTAINLKEAKNFVGGFYQPKIVFINPYFLETLRPRHFREGLAEVIKYGAIKDKNLFKLLEKEYKNIIPAKSDLLSKIITRCIKIKADIVQKDPKEEKGIRTILNFGHTIAHALEASSQYKGSIMHGEAVGMGMIAASNISYYLGYTTSKTQKRITHLLKNFNLPLKAKFNIDKALEALSLDKKFTKGNIRMVLIENIGKVIVKEKIPLKLVKKYLKNLYK